MAAALPVGPQPDTLPPGVEMVDRAVPVAHLKLVGTFNGSHQIGLGTTCRFDEVGGLRQQGRQRGRQGTAGAMSIAGGNTMAGQLDELVAIMQQVDGIVAGQVAAFQKYPPLSVVVQQPA